ncbi:class I SAM-dependent methyltransferase [bacterium]|nr:class I SAM-dependent methyltransferase [bacterium]
MAKIEPFEKYSGRYEDWFLRNEFAYLSEIEAVKKILPDGLGVEIGIGSGRFAIPLGINFGIDPSMKMLKTASQNKNLHLALAIAEKIPLAENTFDFALMVTTICFVDDVEKTFSEIKRILKNGGQVIIGFVDRESEIGKFYQAHKGESLFYNIAEFFSTDEVLRHLENAGFGDFQLVQTIFRPLSEIDSVEPVRDGYGEGSFVVVGAKKQ